MLGFTAQVVQDRLGTQYHLVKMFREMILQAWHSLGDAKMEETLKVRLDFMFFVDFDVAELSISIQF